MEAVQARAQTAENDMGSPAKRRIEQGIVLGIVQDMVLCHREPVGNPVDVTAAEPRYQALDPLQEFFQERCLLAAEGADPVASRPRLGSDDRAVPRHEAGSRSRAK